MNRRPLEKVLVAAMATSGAVYLTQVLASGAHGSYLLVVLAVTWAAAGWSLSAGIPPASAELPARSSTATGRVLADRAFRAGGVIMLVTAFAVGAWTIPHYFLQWHVLLPYWLGCCALAVVGALWLGRLGVPAAPVETRTIRSRLPHVLLLIGCIGVGVAFRLYHITSVPPGLWVDETNIASDALMILDGRPDSPFWVGWWETPTLYAYYMAGLFKLGGVGFWSLKLVTLIPAVLTVVAIYPVGGLLFGPRAGLLAAFFLSVSQWHITMSRWGFNEVMPPLFQLAATALLLHAMRSRRAVDYVLAGLTLGLGMYTYLASRLVVGVFAAYLLYRLVFERDFLRQHFAGLLLFGLSYLLCFGPLCMTYVQSSFALLNRSRALSILNDVQAAGSWQPVVENLRRHLLMFHVEGDHNLRHNLPGHPMLSLVPGALFLLGIGLALRRLGDHRFVLLLLWIAITLQGGILSTLAEGPQAYRTIGVVPAICLLSAAVAEAWLRIVEPFRSLRVLVVVLLFAALGHNAYTTYRAYFVEQAALPNLKITFSILENAVARRLLTERDRVGSLSHVYLSPRFHWFSPVRFLLYRARQNGSGGLEDPDFHMIEPQADLPLVVDATHDLLLLLEVDIAQNLDFLKRYYPHSTTTLVSEDGLPLFSEVVIPKEDLAAIRGLNPVDANGKPLPTADAGQAALVEEHLAMLRPSDALVGALQAPHSGSYLFLLEGPVALEIDGAPVHRSVSLGQGLHDFRLSRLRGEGTPRIRMQGQGQLHPLEVKEVFRLSAPRQGLRGRYYAGREWKGDAIFERIDPVLSFSWPGDEPINSTFSVRWEGELKIEEAGLYVFEIQSDDGSALTLDGEPVATALNEGVQSIRGSRRLEPGLHAITIDYFQAGGGKSLRVRWQTPQGSTEIIPSRLLVPAPLNPPRADQEPAPRQ